jgi:hypothetical protein
MQSPSSFFRLIPLLTLCASPFASSRAADTSAPPEPNQLPRRADLPDPLVMLDGSKVRSREQWTGPRRAELKRLFQHYMYGNFPPAPARVSATVERAAPGCFGGRATMNEITLVVAPANAPAIHLLLVVPNQRAKPAPVILGLNFCGNYSALNDPTIAPPTNWMPNFCEGCTNNAATEAGRGRSMDAWAIEQTIGRGYAVATFYNGDVDPDKPDSTDGLHAALARPGQVRGPQDWGSIAAWAWGLQRAVDYLVTDADLDPARIAVFGHSRNGKTALLAGAFDERIALILCHQAGCGGSAPSRGRIGETVRQINDRFPHWFDDAFKQFNDDVDRLPFDQHCLIALCAPRPVLLSNATEDTWANPAGQFEMLVAADPVYRVLGVEGLAAKAMPDPGRLVDSRLGFFIRPGKHSTTPADWKVFLDFADRHFASAGAQTSTAGKVGALK